MELLNKDSYISRKTKKPLLPIPIRRSRFLFTIRFIQEVFRSGKTARAGKYDAAEWERSSMNIFKLLEKAGARINIEGLDNIRNAEGPVVFISNHMSTMETMIFPGIINPIKKVTFVVKDNLITHPIFKDIMIARKPIVVSRSNSREDLLKVLNEGKEILASGKSIIIFPQSTRYTDFDPSKFNSLGIKLAIKAGCSVIPVAIKTDFWANGKLVKDLGPLRRKEPVHISFGKALKPEGKGKAEHEKVIDYITQHLKEWN